VKENNSPMIQLSTKIKFAQLEATYYICQKITIKYQDTQGKKVKNTFTGFSAQIVQHEIDHLNGILFVDNLIKQKKPLYELIDEEWHEVDLPY